MDVKALRTKFLIDHLNRRFNGFVSSTTVQPIFIPKNAKILIFAPHADDEVIGCAGVVQKCIDEGGTVDLIIITTEVARSIVKPSFVGTENTREVEAIRSQKILNINSIQFWRYKERGLQQLDDKRRLINQVRNYLDENEYDLLLIPNPDDFHPDHRHISKLVLKAIYLLKKRLSTDIKSKFYLYEVWGACNMSHYHILNEAQHKTKYLALSCYKSQLNSVDYFHITNFIEQKRTAELRLLEDLSDPNLLYGAEAFQRINIESFHSIISQIRN